MFFKEFCGFLPFFLTFLDYTHSKSYARWKEEFIAVIFHINVNNNLSTHDLLIHYVRVGSPELLGHQTLNDILGHLQITKPGGKKCVGTAIQFATIAVKNICVFWTVITT